MHGAIPDAQKIYQWVTTAGGVLPENAILITSTANPLIPIKNDVDTAITKMIHSIIKKKTAADRLYFYFAGHGIGVERDLENNGLCMANWNELMRDAAALSSKEYKQKFLNEGHFKEIVIWLDCCRVTKVFFTPASGPGIIPGVGAVQNPKWFFAYAAQYRNEAFETTSLYPHNEPRGIFTDVLLEGLNGAASDEGKPISADDLRDHLKYYVPKRAQEAGYIQQPDVSHNAAKSDPMFF